MSDIQKSTPDMDTSAILESVQTSNERINDNQLRTAILMGGSFVSLLISAVSPEAGLGGMLLSGAGAVFAKKIRTIIGK